MSLVSRGPSEIITCKCCLQHSRSFNSLPVVLLGTPNHAKMMMPKVLQPSVHMSLCVLDGAWIRDTGYLAVAPRAVVQHHLC